MTTIPAIFFYDVVVALHVICIVIAFGVTFVYPAIIPWFTKAHPEAMPAVHEMQVRVGRLIITPFAALALLTGIYLAADRDLFKETWVTIPMVILIVLLGLAGAFFGPREKELAAIARRDLDAEGSLGAEYGAKAQRVGIVGAFASALILIAIFCMVAKPFAYGRARAARDRCRWSPLTGLERHRVTHRQLGGRRSPRVAGAGPGGR